MSQLTQITFVTQAGGSQTLTLQNYVNETSIESWKEPDKALSGKLRQNLRGTRGRYRLSYGHSTEATAFRNLLNNITADLESGIENITLSEDSDLSNARVVVPTESFKKQLQYRNQITDFKPILEFVDVGLNRSTGTYVEAGYVELGYVE